jgi:hypothetical protein
MAFRLTITEGRDRGAEFEFDASEVSFGRGSENDVVVNDAGVSREHARIRNDGGAWKIRDLGSQKGTLVNGRKVEEATLRTGDVIVVGPVSFRFTLENGAHAVSDEATAPMKTPPPAPPPPPDATPPSNPLPAAKAEAARAAEPTRVTDKPKADTTRVSSRPAAGKAAAPPPSGPAAAAPAPPPSLLQRPSLRWGIAAVALALIGAVTWRMLDTAPAVGACPEIFELQAEALEARIGSGPVDYECGDTAAFAFDHSAGTRAVLHYAPLGVDKPGEVLIRLNGKEAGKSPVAPGTDAPPQQLRLDPPALKENTRNVVEFVNTTGDTWAVEGVRVELRGIAAADPERARDRYELGMRKYRERKVAGRNLYDAWKYLLEARTYMEAMEPKPAIWASAEQMISDIERELTRKCRSLLFAAHRFDSYNERHRADEVYRQIHDSYPGEDPSGCRKKIEGIVFESEAPANNTGAP